ncbi:hypothetical protein Dimus_029348 [Dionaea muscipula]
MRCAFSNVGIDDAQVKVDGCSLHMKNSFWHLGSTIQDIRDIDAGLQKWGTHRELYACSDSSSVIFFKNSCAFLYQQLNFLLIWATISYYFSALSFILLCFITFALLGSSLIGLDTCAIIAIPNS